MNIRKKKRTNNVHEDVYTKFIIMCVYVFFYFSNFPTTTSQRPLNVWTQKKRELKENTSCPIKGEYSNRGMINVGRATNVTRTVCAITRQLIFSWFNFNPFLGIRGIWTLTTSIVYIRPFLMSMSRYLLFVKLF